MDNLDRASTIDYSARRDQSPAERAVLERARKAFMARHQDSRIWLVDAGDPLGSNHLAEQAVRENLHALCHHLTLDPYELEVYLNEPRREERMYGGSTLTSDDGEVDVVIHITPGTSYEGYVRRLAHELRHVWQIVNHYNPAQHGLTLEDDAEAYEEQAVQRCKGSVRDFFMGRIHTSRRTPYYPYADRMADRYEMPAVQNKNAQPHRVQELNTSGEKTLLAFILGGLLGLWWGD